MIYLVKIYVKILGKEQKSDNFPYMHMDDILYSSSIGCSDSVQLISLYI
jgi:hypothetical protein